MQIEIIDSKSELLKDKTQILSLFTECYGKNLDASIWEWAYIDNVFGDPIVAVLRDAGKIVAHYAVIPFFLENGFGKEIKSYLSMTTMVAPSHQGKGLFVKLADANYEHIIKKNGEMVFGFPNQQSAHGFKKYLSWSLEEMDYVASVEVNKISADDVYKHYISDKNRFALNAENSEIRKWRMAKSKEDYIDLGGCIIKKFGDMHDLIWIRNADALSSFPKDKKINFLVDSANKKHLENKIFDYQFGYRSFVSEYSGLNICKTLSLSDVF